MVERQKRQRCLLVATRENDFRVESLDIVPAIADTTKIRTITTLTTTKMIITTTQQSRKMKMKVMNATKILNVTTVRKRDIGLRIAGN